MRTSETLQAVINTLNIIPVNGEQNLSRLLGCIQTLNTLKSELDKQEVTAKHDDNFENQKP